MAEENISLEFSAAPIEKLLLAQRPIRQEQAALRDDMTVPHPILVTRRNVMDATRLDAVEWATLEWVEWYNHRRLLEPIGHIPPAEADARY